MAAQTQQQRKAAGRKAAATRARNRTARQSAQTAAHARATGREAEKTAVQAEGAVEAGAAYALERAKALAGEAERAVLIPLGATLVARDKSLVARDNVVELFKPYTLSRESAQREVTRSLRKFERRGTTARNRAVRRLKRTRTSFERVVRGNRVEAERQVKAARRDFQRGAERIQHASVDVAKGVQELADVAS